MDVPLSMGQGESYYDTSIQLIIALTKRQPDDFFSVFSSGAFAKRDLPKDTIVTGTPLLAFPTGKWFDMYRSQICPDGSIHRNTTGGPIGKQLLLNYCFGHPESTIHLCPVSLRIM